MKKEEQKLKNEIASVQLRLIKEKRTYLTKKRKLQLQILEKQLGSSETQETNEGKTIAGVSEYIYDVEIFNFPFYSIAEEDPSNLKNEYHHDEEMNDSPRATNV